MNTSLAFFAGLIVGAAGGILLALGLIFIALKYKDNDNETIY